MKLRGIQIGVNSIRKGSNFVRNTLKMELIGHKDYKNKFIYSRTKFGYEGDDFELILYNKWRNWLEWNPRTENMIHIDLINSPNMTITKQFEIGTKISNGTVNKVTQIDLCVRDLQKTRDFYINTLKMKVFQETDTFILMGYDESPRICLKKHDQYFTCEIYIDGIENELTDPNGFKFCKYDEFEGGFKSYIGLEKRIWIVNSKILAIVCIVGFVYLIDDKRPWRRLVFLIKKYFEFD